MALKLPRFFSSSRLVQDNGTPTLAFHQWWDTVLKQIEEALEDIRLALLAAGVALDGGGALPPMNVRTITASDSAAAADTLIIADATAGDITVTLPPAASKTGLEIIVKKISDPPRVVKVQGSGTEEIDGATDIDITVKNEAVHIVSDGTAWWRI